MRGVVLDKWSAFVTSLLLPGLGQLLTKQWGGVVWLGAALSLGAVRWSLGTLNVWANAGLMAAGLGLALVSAEHAKRSLEPRRLRSGSRPVVGAVVTRLRVARSVEARFEILSERSQTELWNDLVSWNGLTQFDPFHQAIRSDSGSFAVGSRLEIEHCACGLQLIRKGRVLVHEFGRRFAFSDLSRFGSRYGFPHVLFFDLEAVPFRANSTDGRLGTRLTVTARGKWTSRMIPVSVGLFWIKCVSWEHRRLLAQML